MIPKDASRCKFRPRPLPQRLAAASFIGDRAYISEHFGCRETEDRLAIRRRHFQRAHLTDAIGHAHVERIIAAEQHVIGAERIDDDSAAPARNAGMVSK